MLAQNQAAVINFANPALDRVMGGIPIPSLTLIEAPNDAGKSVLSQQTAFGALAHDFTVRYITTENTFGTLVKQMDSLSFTVYKKVIGGKFRITELHTEGIPWNTETAAIYLNAASQFIFDCQTEKLIIIDSLTSFVSQASSDEIVKFFSEMREIVDKKNKCVVITLHPYAFPPDLLTRVRSMCDGHFILSIKEIRGKVVRTLEVAKLRGATMRSAGIVTFDVDPAFGIRITPLTSARG